MTPAAGSLERFEALLSPRGHDLLERLDADPVTPATALRAGPPEALAQEHRRAQAVAQPRQLARRPARP